jgi:hypothetical protein
MLDISAEFLPSMKTPRAIFHFFLDRGFKVIEEVTGKALQFNYLHGSGVQAILADMDWSQMKGRTLKPLRREAGYDGLDRDQLTRVTPTAHGGANDDVRKSEVDHFVLGLWRGTRGVPIGFFFLKKEKTPDLMGAMTFIQMGPLSITVVLIAIAAITITVITVAVIIGCLLLFHFL